MKLTCIHLAAEAKQFRVVFIKCGGSEKREVEIATIRCISVHNLMNNVLCCGTME